MINIRYTQRYQPKCKFQSRHHRRMWPPADGVTQKRWVRKGVGGGGELLPSPWERETSRTCSKLAVLSQGWKSPFTGVPNLRSIRWPGAAWQFCIWEAPDGFSFQGEVEDGRGFPMDEQRVWQKEEPAWSRSEFFPRRPHGRVTNRHSDTDHQKIRTEGLLWWFSSIEPNK